MTTIPSAVSRADGPAAVGVPSVAGLEVPVAGHFDGCSTPSPLAVAAIALVLVALYVPEFAHATTVWAADQEFTFGFLVPPLTLFLLWRRRHALWRALGPGATSGLLPLLGGLLLLLAGARLDIHALAAASFGFTALGAIAFLWGWPAAHAVALPIVFLTCGLSLYRGLLNTLGFALQQLTAQNATLLATRLGVPVRLSGVDLFTGRLHFTVAEACSGLSSLVALLCVGTFIVGLTSGAVWRRGLLIVLIVPLVLAANVLRVTLVLALARTLGDAVARGFLHGLFSAVLFLIALALFGIAGGVLGCFGRTGVTELS